ncbi:MAG: hypothetical protein NTZ33_09095 [Bacteroidetes bacterium]|nr:hypothetical protein [Bacteroidota bacterium]
MNKISSINSNSKKLAFKSFICFFVLLLCLLFDINTIAAQQKSDTVIITEKNWDKIKKGVDYTENYKEFKSKPNSSFHFPSFFIKSIWVQFITAFIILCILAFLIYKILVKYNISLNPKISKNTDVKLLEENPDIDELDLEAMLINVLKNEDFKLAIRIRFLQVIKLLDKISCIKWEKDKTNGDYINEMRKYEELTDFMYLVLIFNTVWYGDKLLNVNDFAILNTYFENFIQKMMKNEQ